MCVCKVCSLGLTFVVSVAHDKLLNSLVLRFPCVYFSWLKYPRKIFSNKQNPIYSTSRAIPFQNNLGQFTTSGGRFSRIKCISYVSQTHSWWLLTFHSWKSTYCISSSSICVSVPPSIDPSIDLSIHLSISLT